MFETVIRPLLLAAIATGLAAGLWYHWRSARLLTSQRGGLLDQCKPLFDHGSKIIAESGYPRLSGHYRGHEFDLQLVKDTLNIRKLPTLWLLVSLIEKLPVRGSFDLMMRPRGVEVFSRFASLPVQVNPPAGFPHDCAIRTDNPRGLPPEDLLQRHIGFFDDPLAKELVISPKGLRVVWLAEEAHRGKYLIFREAELGAQPIKPSDLHPILDYLLALRADLVTASEGPAP